MVMSFMILLFMIPGILMELAGHALRQFLKMPINVPIWKYLVLVHGCVWAGFLPPLFAVSRFNDTTVNLPFLTVLSSLVIGFGMIDGMIVFGQLLALLLLWPLQRKAKTANPLLTEIFS